MTVRQDKVIRSYGSLDTPLLVPGDVSGLELALPDVAGNKTSTE
jgi:hypothetical protein